MCNIDFACLVLILFDVLTGITAAVKNKELCSTSMREGLYNKIGEVLLLVLAAVCSCLMEAEPISSLGVPANVMDAVGVYIAGMELLSIVENICKIAPDLPLAKVLYIFNIKSQKKNDAS